MKNKRVILMILFLAAAFLLPVMTEIEITGENGEIRHMKAFPGDVFTIAYIHSMYNVRQEERYQIGKHDFLHKSMFFGDMQAAAYYDSFALYPLIKNLDGSAVIEEINRIYPAISFAVGHGTQYTFTVQDGEQLDVNTAFPRSGRLTILVKKLNLLEYMNKGWLN